MAKNVLDYLTPAGLDVPKPILIGFRFGRISLLFIFLSPLGFIFWIFFLPLLLISLFTAIVGTIMSSGRSKCGIISLSLLGSFILWCCLRAILQF
jgi:hypothetical protein